MSKSQTSLSSRHTQCGGEGGPMGKEQCGSVETLPDRYRQCGVAFKEGRAGGFLNGSGAPEEQQRRNEKMCIHIPGAVLSLRSTQGCTSQAKALSYLAGLKFRLEHLQVLPLSWPTHLKDPIKF